jgi:uncharacterized membrane protein YheB (UPF0754 family)
MNSLLLWIIPPAIGALIGYVTNAVAIKMLFRPLTEKRIFGIRIPFTPGILPRERRKLADSLGRMVERELLTPEILKERLARPEVREKIGKSVSEYTAKLLTQPLSGWSGGIPAPVITVAGAVYPKAAGALVDFLGREDIRTILETQGRQLLFQAILKLNVFQRLFVSAAQYDRTLEEKMPEIVSDILGRLDTLLKSPEAEKQVLSILEKEIRRFPEKHPGANLENLLTLDAAGKERLDAFLTGRILTMAEEQIESLLNTVNVRTLVSERVDSLDMLRVERIILDVMAGQLKWINIFGAILGAIIGLVQVLLSLGTFSKGGF